MTRKCDGCGKNIPIGSNDFIELKAWGKFGAFLKEIAGDSHLDFCSFQCWSDFQEKTQKKLLEKK